MVGFDAGDDPAFIKNPSAFTGEKRSDKVMNAFFNAIHLPDGQQRNLKSGFQTTSLDLGNIFGSQPQRGGLDVATLALLGLVGVGVFLAFRR